MANKSGDNSLHDWFNKSKSSDGKKGWVQLGGKYSGKPCARQPGQKTKPKCGSSKMKRDLSKSEEESAFRRKNKQDGNPNRRGKAKNVRTEGKTYDQFMEANSSASEMRNKILKPLDNAVSSIQDRGKDHRQRLIHQPVASIKNKLNSMKTPGANYTAGNPGLQKLKGQIGGAAKSAINLVGRIKNPLSLGKQDRSRHSSEATDNLKDATGLGPGSDL